MTRVVEIETRDGPPDLLFPGLKPEQVQKIRWLQPHFAGPSGMLYTSIPSFIVESEGKRIIVDTGGDSWVDLAGLRTLPSADTWSFPPRPHTHHVRWIEADVSVANRVFLAIEAGAFVLTFDGGRTWHDRVPGGPYDTHTAVTNPLAPGRIYSAAGDGYFESSILSYDQDQDQDRD